MAFARRVELFAVTGREAAKDFGRIRIIVDVEMPFIVETAPKAKTARMPTMLDMWRNASFCQGVLLNAKMKPQRPVIYEIDALEAPLRLWSGAFIQLGNQSLNIIRKSLAHLARVTRSRNSASTSARKMFSGRSSTF